MSSASSKATPNENAKKGGQGVGSTTTTKKPALAATKSASGSAQKPESGSKRPGSAARARKPAPLKKLTSVSVMPPANAKLKLEIEEPKSEKSKSKSLTRTIIIPASVLPPSVLKDVKESLSSNNNNFYNALQARNLHKERVNANANANANLNVNTISGHSNGNGDGNVGVGNGGGGSTAQGIFSKIFTLVGFGDRDYVWGPFPRGYGVTLIALGCCYGLLRYERGKIEKCKRKPSMTCTEVWFARLKSVERQYNLARKDFPKTSFLILLGGIGMPYASAVGAFLWCAGRLTDFHQAGGVGQSLSRSHIPQEGPDSNNNSSTYLPISPGSSKDLSGSSSKSGKKNIIHADGTVSVVGAMNTNDQIEPLFCRCGKFLMICGICKLGFDFSRGGIKSLVSFD